MNKKTWQERAIPLLLGITVILWILGGSTLLHISSWFDSLIQLFGQVAVFGTMALSPLIGATLGIRMLRRGGASFHSWLFLVTNILFVIAFIVLPGKMLLNKAQEPQAPPNPSTPRSLQPQSGIPVFPGAEGFGSHTPAGRGGKVIEVTSLADNGPGTLREALTNPSPRIIVFRVGGTIELQTPIEVSDPFVTVAGQTAPGGGIAIKGQGILIKTHDVLLQYLRVRPGLTTNDNWGVYIAGTEPTFDGTYNVVVDHVSASWVGVDAETMSIFGGAHDVTISHSIISESLEPYGHGILIGYGAYNTSIHHNLFAHDRQRNPHISDGGTHDIVNNVIYDWGFGGTGITDNDSNSFINLVGNYFLPGPSTDRHPELYEVLISSGKNGVAQLYVSGNIGPHRPDETISEWAPVGVYRIPGVTPGVASETYRSGTRFSVAPVSASSAPEAFEHVLAQAGATVPKRDPVDERIISDVRNETGTLITSPEEVGGYPVLAPGIAPADSDHDGMPDAWETSHGLDPRNSADGNADANGNGYTNVEEYLHSLMKQ